jgi:hypothetical protein
MTVVYARGGQYSPESKSPIFDEIVLNTNNQAADNKDKLDAVALINRQLRPFEPDRVISGSPTAEQTQLLAIHQSTIERLERLNEDLIRQSSEFRQRLESDYDERAKKNDQALEIERGAISEEFKGRAAELDAKTQALEEKLKVIDDRDNTHARREIRDSMLEDVKLRVIQFGVSVATERKRRLVVMGIALLIVGFALLLCWTAFEIASLNSQYYSRLETMRNFSSMDVEKLKGTNVRT